MQDARHPGRVLMLIVTGIVAVLLGGLLTDGIASAVPPPPPNPTDAELDQSREEAAATAELVGELSAEVSTTQATIDRLHAAMELKAELALKARVDLEIAQDDARAAREHAAAAQTEADEAGEAIAAAQGAASDFAAASFRQGSVLGSMTALLDVDSLDQLLARREMIEQVSGTQSGVLANLQSARTTKANLDSQARAALIDAEAAEDAAEAARVEADAAEAAAARSFDEGQEQLRVLEAKLVEQQEKYQAALNSVTELEGQRAQYNAWLAAKQEEEARLAEQERIQAEQAKQFLKQKQEEEARAQALRDAQSKAVSKEKKRQDDLARERQRQADLKRAQEQAKSGSGSGSGGPSAPPPSNGDRGSIVVNAALAWLGTPYAWGGGNSKGPTRGIRDYGVADRHGDYKKIGFDCSGLALYAYAQVGISLPHYSGYQYNYGKKVPRANLQPGDLVFYAYNTSRPTTIHHVAIYMGNNQMVEAPQSGSVVKISPMRWSGYIGATRPGT